MQNMSFSIKESKRGPLTQNKDYTNKFDQIYYQADQTLNMLLSRYKKDKKSKSKSKEKQKQISFHQSSVHPFTTSKLENKQNLEAIRKNLFAQNWNQSRVSNQIQGKDSNKNINLRNQRNYFSPQSKLLKNQSHSLAAEQFHSPKVSFLKQQSGADNKLSESEVYKLQSKMKQLQNENMRNGSCKLISHLKTMQQLFSNYKQSHLNCLIQIEDQFSRQVQNRLKLSRSIGQNNMKKTLQKQILGMKQKQETMSKQIKKYIKHIQQLSNYLVSLQNQSQNDRKRIIELETRLSKKEKQWKQINQSNQQQIKRLRLVKNQLQKIDSQKQQLLKTNESYLSLLEQNQKLILEKQKIIKLKQTSLHQKQNKIKQTLTQNQKLVSQVKQYTQYNKTLKIKLQTMSSTVTSFQTKFVSYQKQIQQSRSLLYKQNLHNSRLEHESLQIKEQNERILKRLNELDKARTTITQTLHIMQSNLESSNHQKQMFTKQIQKLEEKLNQKDKILIGLKEELKKRQFVESENQAFCKDIQGKTKQIEQYIKLQNFKQTQITNLKQSMFKLQQETKNIIKQKNLEIKTKEKKIYQSQTQIKQLNVKINNFVKQLKQRQKIIKDQENQIKNNIEKIKLLKQQSTQLKKQIQQKTSQFQNILYDKTEQLKQFKITTQNKQLQLTKIKQQLQINNISLNNQSLSDKNKIKQLQQKIIVINNEKLEIQKLLQEEINNKNLISQEIIVLKKQIQTYNTNLNKIQIDIKKKQDLILSKQNQIELLQSKNLQMQQYKKNLLNNFNEKQQNFLLLQNQLSIQIKMKKDIQFQIDSLKSNHKIQLQNQTKSIQNLNNIIQNLNKQLIVINSEKDKLIKNQQNNKSQRNNLLQQIHLLSKNIIQNQQYLKQTTNKSNDRLKSIINLHKKYFQIISKRLQIELKENTIQQIVELININLQQK